MATKMTMPQMGYDMQEGTLVRWLKSVGDEVSLGEAVAEIETDKAVVEFESTAEGVLLELLVEEGTTVAVGESIATVGVEGETVAADGGDSEESAEAVAEEPSEPDAEEAPEAEEDESEADAIPLPASPSEVRASPIARKLAAERGVDLNTVEGTGPGGRILRSDVLAAEPMPAPAEEPEEEPAEAPEAVEEPPMPEEEAPEVVEEEEPAEAVEEEPAMEVPEEVEESAEPEPEPEEPEADDMGLVPLTRMRQQIARTTVGSKTTIPHFYVSTDIDMTDAMSLRKEINASLEGDARVSVNDLVIKACVHTIKGFPKFNSSYTDGGIRMHDSINIGIAIADENGLIMPAILDCGDKSLTEISAASKDLVQRSQSGTLHAEEYTGGTFSISNMGMFDVTSFVAIIQPPQSAVLAIGTVQKKPVVQGDSVVVREI
ncbi:MAG: dihydrolipoamide acetyltransferase family protein, partial [Chloroflexota bacterium]|nr:dihydrolipoamide acetyltransferase family protein [Chloroflexota bacterium]